MQMYSETYWKTGGRRNLASTHECQLVGGREYLLIAIHWCIRIYLEVSPQPEQAMNGHLESLTPKLSNDLFYLILLNIVKCLLSVPQAHR